jgi:hypothetical protein
MIFSIAGAIWCAGSIGPDCEITAGDIESDARERDLILVCNYPANGLGVSLVAIRTQNTALCSGFYATGDLRQQ